MFILIVGKILQAVSDNLGKGMKMHEKVMAKSARQAENKHNFGQNK